MSINKYFSQNIAKRVLITFFFFSFVMTTISTVYILYSQYSNEKKQILNDSRHTLINQSNPLSQVLWNLDKSLAHTILNSLTYTPSFTYITLNDEQGQIFASSGAEQTTYSAFIQVPLSHSINSKIKGKKIGTIKAYVTTSAAERQIKDNFFSIIFAQIIKSFISSFVLLLLMYKILIQHILTINKYIVSYDPDTQNFLKNKLKLDRPYTDDELQRLVKTINTSIKKHNKNIKTSKKENKHLAKEIKKRREAEIKTLASHEQLLHVLNSLTKSVFSCNADGEVLFMNHRALKLLNHHHSIGATTDIKLFFNDIVSFCKDDIANSESINLIDFASKSNHVSKTKAYFIPQEGGKLTPVSITLIPTRHGKLNHKSGLIVIVSDESQRAKYKEMSYRASHDHLTKIYNRSYITQQINNIVKNKKSGYCFAIIDLDKFKNVNDTCGHRAGDELLKLVSKTIPNALSHNDTFARIGGDEFALLLHATPEKSLQITQRIITDIESLKFTYEGHRLDISCSIGVTRINNKDSLETIMSQADQACYQIKRSGKGASKLYKPQHNNITKQLTSKKNKMPS